MTRQLSIRVVTNLDGFSELASDWTHLLERSESREIFLSHEWLYHWTKQYLGVNRLWILVFVDQRERVCAIAPFYIRRVRRNVVCRYREIAFLGSEAVGSSYLDIIVERQWKQAVMLRLYDFLFQEVVHEWDVLTLEEVPTSSLTIDTLVDRFEQAGKVVQIVRSSGCAIIRLPRSSAEYRRTLSANSRYNLQRKNNALQRIGMVSYRHIEKGAEVASGFDSFVRLHEKRWIGKGAEGGAFHRAGFRSFHQDIARVFAERGWLTLSFLTLDDQPIAGIYGFVYGGTYYFYLPGFDPDIAPHASPGLLLLAHRIEQAIEEGYRLVDLLQGDARYKTSWANDTRRSLTLQAYNRCWPAFMLRCAQSVRQALKILLR
ncbi:MAG: GNAT family N-acetyltransferase [Nitrospiraceae bacterium]